MMLTSRRRVALIVRFVFGNIPLPRGFAWVYLSMRARVRLSRKAVRFRGAPYKSNPKLRPSLKRRSLRWTLKSNCFSKPRALCGWEVLLYPRAAQHNGKLGLKRSVVIEWQKATARTTKRHGHTNKESQESCCHLKQECQGKANCGNPQQR